MNADTDMNRFGVKANTGQGVADLSDHPAGNGLIVRREGRGDLAHQMDFIGAGRHLAGNMRVRVVDEDLVQHRVGDLVADFIGMSARDGLRGKVGLHLRRFLSARPFWGMSYFSVLSILDHIRNAKNEKVAKCA